MGDLLTLTGHDDWDGLRYQARSSHALQESFHPNATGYAQGYLHLVNTVTG